MLTAGRAGVFIRVDRSDYTEFNVNVAEIVVARRPNLCNYTIF